MAAIEQKTICAARMNNSIRHQDPSFVVHRHQTLLERLKLNTLENIRAYEGAKVKAHRGRRDVLRIVPPDARPDEPVLFLKRTFRPYRKDGLGSFLRRGRVWSISREEWENAWTLERAGFRVAQPVAYGEECGPLWEKFSFIITEMAEGDQTVDDFLRSCGDHSLRRKVLDALAREVRKIHDAGLASPDFFTRHFFLDLKNGPPRFCLIDMGRLDRARSISDRLRARDLAALNVSAPVAFVSPRERVRFLRTYAGGKNRKLARLIRRRMEQLLKRRKYRWFLETPADSCPDISSSNSVSR